MKVLPAAITCGNQHIRPKRALNEFVQLDLFTPRLDKIYRYLWLAGEPAPARPLHRQRLLRREIVLTESPDEHLVEDRAVIFVKPLPEYLLSFEFWTTHLSADRDLHQSACGLLLSYVWIVTYRSDVSIAEETHLLPKSLDWAAWKDFVEDFLEHVGTSTPLHVSKRYNYGELWLRPSECDLQIQSFSVLYGKSCVRLFERPNVVWILPRAKYHSPIYSFRFLVTGLIGDASRPSDTRTAG